MVILSIVMIYIKLLKATLKEFFDVNKERTILNDTIPLSVICHAEWCVEPDYISVTISLLLCLFLFIEY